MLSLYNRIINNKETSFNIYTCNYMYMLSLYNRIINNKETSFNIHTYNMYICVYALCVIFSIATYSYMKLNSYKNVTGI